MIVRLRSPMGAAPPENHSGNPESTDPGRVLCIILYYSYDDLDLMPAQRLALPMLLCRSSPFSEYKVRLYLHDIASQRILRMADRHVRASKGPEARP